MHDDGSTDGALDGIDPGIIVLRHETNQGIGAAMKRVFEYVLANGYDVLVIHAGNDKDDPLEIPLLVEPIRAGTADFVQGSRYLGGGGFGNMPSYRVLGTRRDPSADLFDRRPQARDREHQRLPRVPDDAAARPEDRLAAARGSTATSSSRICC